MSERTLGEAERVAITRYVQEALGASMIHGSVTDAESFIQGVSAAYAAFGLAGIGPRPQLTVPLRTTLTDADIDGMLS